MLYARIICRLSFHFLLLMLLLLLPHAFLPFVKILFYVCLFVCLNRLMFCHEHPYTNGALMMQFNRNFLLPKAKISHHHFRPFFLAALSLLLFCCYRFSFVKSKKRNESTTEKNKHTYHGHHHRQVHFTPNWNDINHKQTVWPFQQPFVLNEFAVYEHYFRK